MQVLQVLQVMQILLANSKSGERYYKKKPFAPLSGEYEPTFVLENNRTSLQKANSQQYLMQMLQVMQVIEVIEVIEVIHFIRITAGWKTFGDKRAQLPNVMLSPFAALGVNSAKDLAR